MALNIISSLNSLVLDLPTTVTPSHVFDLSSLNTILFLDKDFDFVCFGGPSV